MDSFNVNINYVNVSISVGTVLKFNASFRKKGETRKCMVKLEFMDRSTFSKSNSFKAYLYAFFF